MANVKSFDLKNIYGTTLDDIYMVLFKVLQQAPINFIIYGSSARREERTEFGDIDLLTPKPTLIIDYVITELSKEIPNLYYNVKRAIHKTTHRLQVDQITILDATYIPDGIFYRLYESCDEVDMMHGRYSTPFMTMLDMAKLLCLPAQSFNGNPYVSLANSSKFEKATAQINDLLKARPKLLLPSAPATKKIHKATVPLNGVTYGGIIAIACYEHVLGINKVIQDIKKEDTMHLVTDYPLLPFTVFNTDQRLHQNEIYNYVFNDLLPNGVSIKYGGIIYDVNGLPPELIYVRVDTPNGKVQLVNPMFLLFEFLSMQLIPKTHPLMKYDYNWDDIFTRILCILTHDINPNKHELILPEGYSSLVNPGSFATYNLMTQDMADELLKQYDIIVPSNVVISEGKKPISHDPSLHSLFWNI